jgi:hypothetical protein
VLLEVAGRRLPVLRWFTSVPTGLQALAAAEARLQSTCQGALLFLHASEEEHFKRVSGEGSGVEIALSLGTTRLL